MLDWPEVLDEELERAYEPAMRATRLGLFIRLEWHPSNPVPRPTRPVVSLEPGARQAQNIWSPPERPSAQPGASFADPSAEIDFLYGETRRLAREAEADPRVEVAYQQAMERLRELQAREAKEWVARFNANRALQPGAGYAALQRADELIAKYAHLTAENSATEDADPPTSPTEPVE